MTSVPDAMRGRALGLLSTAIGSLPIGMYALGELAEAIGASAAVIVFNALGWADAIMGEYSLEDRSHAAVIAEAAKRGIGVVVKKGLASGRLAAADAIHFVLDTPGVSSLLIGSLSLDHLRENVREAGDLRVVRIK